MKALSTNCTYYQAYVILDEINKMLGKDLTDEEKIGQYGKYVIVLFSQPAQQFIFDNIDAIARYKDIKKKKTIKNF